MARWQALMEQTRWRLALRVLPFVLLSIVVLGVFSWAVFSRHLVDEFVAHQEEQACTDLERLADRAALAAVVLEARASDLFGASAVAGGEPACEDLLAYDLLSGMALAGPGGGDGSRPAYVLQEALRSPANVASLDDWFASRDPVASPSLLTAAFRGPRGPLRASLADGNPWHPVVIYPPFLLAGTPDGAAGRAVLPVLVVENDGECARVVGDPHKVFFLDLARLAGEAEPHAWWCLVDDAGRVLAGADGAPAPGVFLSGQPRGDGPFKHFSGDQMLAAAPRVQLLGHMQGGPRLSPWVATRTSGRSVPVTLLTVSETAGMRAMSLRFAAGVMLAALAAMVLPLVGVSRVAGAIGARLALLARNLEAVARGDYSRRLDPGRQDEVGELIGYFNLMTVSLDEAHRQLRENESGLQITVENMRQLDRAKDDFLMLVSHEVRTPLTSIMAGVDYLKSTLGRTGPAEQELLRNLNLDEVVGIIESSGQRLGGFMQDAIQMTSIQSVDKELQLQPVPAGHLLEVGLCGVRERAEARGITVENALSGQDEWCVLCDQRVLKLALEKVLKNAVQHNREGGAVIIREAERVPGVDPTDLLPNGEMIHRLMSQGSFRAYEDEEISWRVIEVFNTGRPIPADRRRALFGKFELVGRIENHQRGSGLSLPIAQCAVQHHGGRIFVHSTDEGNSFYLLLPTLRGPAAGADGLGDDQAEGLRGVAGHEEVGQVADPAGLEVELDDAGAGLAGGADQPGGGVDGAGGADDEAQLATGGRLR